MGRAPRIWFPGACYHIVVRGNRQQDIFYEPVDRLMYLDKLRRVKTRTGFKLHSYVLMTNHVHLLLETGEISISEIMRDINSFYTREFNKKYELVGHLFQGRYRSILVEQDTYLLEVSRYIHLNPVRAKIVTRPEDYPWSSYRGYIYGGDDLVYSETILSMVGSPERAVNQYKSFVESRLVDVYYSLEDKIADGDILGSTEFVREIQSTYF